jgi:phosphatidylglycerol:prolipoprotein diacylglycerol transferase
MIVIDFPQIDPAAFYIPVPFIGWWPVRWYALAYIAGLLGAWWFMLRLLKTERLWTGAPFNGKPQVTRDHIGDLFVWAAFGVIVGGRLGYVLFYGLIYQPNDYLESPWRVFAAWEGGMSFHGGAIGVVLAIILFARAKKLDMVALGDLVAIATPIGLFFGRIANFVNGELWGKVSDAPWAMVFPSAAVRQADGTVLSNPARHPSQLYEAALEGVVLFIILYVLVHRFDALRKPGLVIAVFWAGYGFFRIVVEEFFRENSHQSLGFISMGTLLSLAMFAFAGVFFWYSLYRKGPALQTQ